MANLDTIRRTKK